MTEQPQPEFNAEGDVTAVEPEQPAVDTPAQEVELNKDEDILVGSEDAPVGPAIGHQTNVYP